ncbi:hypothetical protein CDAR_437261 [Caerostris darwini]|uniref:Uncharacterized protein n=1 Tax=Caerostris darwini TaxID=1538125 RepID=A0AAV4V5Z7_9ARAC|nr:hypothetical protein CDAR_437261 [Caerostris darwini]
MANESTLDVSTIQGNETPFDNEQTTESNINAITFYNCIVNLTDSRDLKKEIKIAFRENAANLLKIISAQNNKIAQLEGRIFELEKYKEEESETRKKSLINETIAMAKPSFATVTKAMASKEPKAQKQIRPVTKQKFITSIKPVEKEVDSLTTKKAVQRAIDVRTMNIAIKNVRSINNGGILIETVTEKDLDKLISEFKAKDALKTSYNIAKTVARKPHITCFEVSPDTGEDQFVEGLRKNFNDSNESLEEDFSIKHHYQTKRGVNWIVEVNPHIFERVIKTKKLNHRMGKDLIQRVH